MVAKKTAKKISVNTSSVAIAIAPLVTLEAPVSSLPALLVAPLSVPSTPSHELAAGLSDEEDLISLSSVHISDPPMHEPIVHTGENFRPELIETTELDHKVAAIPRLLYVHLVTRDIPLPKAPFPPNTKLIALQAEFTTKEVGLLKMFKNHEKIRRAQNFTDSIRMKELGLSEAFDRRVKGEDTEIRSKYDHQKSERSTVQAPLELLAVQASAQWL